MSFSDNDYYLGHDDLIERFAEAAKGIDATHMIKYSYIGRSAEPGFMRADDIGVQEETIALNINDPRALKAAFRQILEHKATAPLDTSTDEITIYPLRDDNGDTLDYSLADDLKTKDLPAAVQKFVKTIEDRIAYEQKSTVRKALSRKPII